MLGHKIIAAAANDKPFDIKELVNEALHLKANELLSEGFKIVADKQYGGLDEGRYKGKTPYGKLGNRKVRRAVKSNVDDEAKINYYSKNSEKRQKTSTKPLSDRFKKTGR